MKKLILLTGLLIAGLGINAQTAKAKANQNEDPAVKANRQTEKLTQELGLTADQKTKVYAINLQKDQAVAAAKTKDGADAKTFADERKVIRTEREKEIKALLTADQLVKLEKMKQANKGSKTAPGNE